MKVVTKDRKYRVRTRESVVRPSEATRIRDTVVTNLYLQETSAPQSPAFEASVPRVTKDGRFRLAHVEVRVPARELALLASGGGKRKGSISLFVAAGREFGDASDVSELKKDFELPAERDASAPIVYIVGVRIRPDTRRLSVAMRDNTTGAIATKVLQLRPE